MNDKVTSLAPPPLARARFSHLALLGSVVLAECLLLWSISDLGNFFWGEWLVALQGPRATVQLGRSLVLLLVLLVLLQGQRLSRNVAKWLYPRSYPNPLNRWCLLHILATFVLCSVTPLVTARINFIDPRAALILVGAWFLLSALTVFTAVQTFSPRELRRSLLRSASISLLIFCAAIAAIYFSTSTARYLYAPLIGSTLRVVHWLLAQSAFDVVYLPTQHVIGTTAFQVQINWQCSGVEGLTLVLCFVVGLLWYSRHSLRFPNALALLPLGLVAMWLLNAFRIASLILIGHFDHPQLALGGFHSQAGWLAFNFVALGIVALSRKLPWIQQERVSPKEWYNPTVPWVMPWFFMMSVALVSAAITEQWDWLYPARVLGAIFLVFLFRASYRHLIPSFSWQALALGIAAFLVWILIPSQGNGSAGISSGIANLPPAVAAIWLAFRLGGYLIAVPISEELAFRGFLMRRLACVNFDDVSLRCFSWTGWLASSLAFGVLHGEKWLAGTIAGLMFGLAARIRGRIGDAVVAHATTNGLLVIMAVATSNWSLIS